MTLAAFALFAAQAAPLDLRGTAARQDEFGLAALQALAEPGQNTVVSPNNLLYALAGLYPASSGESRRALERALGLGPTPEANRLPTLRLLFRGATTDHAQLETAAAAWIDDSIRPKADYFAAVRQGLGYEMRGLDLQAPDALPAINGWVKDATRQKVPTILEELPRESVLVLTSALYYKAPWEFPTRLLDEPLLFGEGRDPVKTMGTTAVLEQIDAPEFRAVFVPFKGEGTLEIYVPKGERTPRQIAAAALAARDQATPAYTALRMPLWKTEFYASVKEALSASGLAPILEDRNEFRGIAEDVFVLDAFHRTWVDLNEKGIEAAAATAVVVGRTSAPADDPKPFDVDRPFFVVVRNRSTGAALFMGFVHKPTVA